MSLDRGGGYLDIATQTTENVDGRDQVALVKTRENRIRFYTTRMLFSLLGVVVALLFIEIAFRTFSSLTRTHSLRSDRPHRYFLREGLPYSPWMENIPAKAPGEFRILVLGDSFSYGPEMQPDDTFSARLERRLSLNKSGRKITVFNWGVPGYSTAQEADLFRREGKRVEADLVVLQVTLNDPELEPYRVSHPWLDNHGQVALNEGIFSVWKSLKFAVSRILNARSHSEYVSYYFGLFKNPATWGRFVAATKDIKRFADENKIPIFVVTFPLLSHPINEQYPFEPLHEQIHALLRELKLPFVDLIRDFAGLPIERLQLIPGLDSHPNEIAHRIAGDAIYRALTRQKMVPPENIATHIVDHR